MARPVAPNRATVWAAMALVVLAGYSLAVQVRLPFGLRAKYFSTENWSGPPVLQVVDREMSAEVLGERTTDFLSRYSVEWSGYLVVHGTGVYRFTTNSDDGSELAIDDRTVVSNRGVHGLQTAEGRVTLNRGVHPIWVQYQQSGGAYGLTVQWGREGEPLGPLSNRSLLADQLSYSRFWVLFLGPTLVGLLSAAAFWFALQPVSRLKAWSSQTRMARASSRWLVWLERPSVAIALLVAVGAAARLVMMLGSTAILWPDSEVFYFTTRLILDGQPWQHDPFRTLAYPFFLAAFLRWGETPEVGTAIVAAQHALGLIATVLFYLAGRRAFSPLVALCGALLFSVHSIELFYETSILSDILFVFAVAVLVFEVVRVRSSASIWSHIWLGAVCALATLVRPVGQWLVVCIVPVLWISRPTRRRALIDVAVMAGTTVVLLLPWMAVNQREFGFFGINIGRGMGLFTRAFEIDKLPLPEPTRYPHVKEIAEKGAALHWSANRIRDELNYGLGESSYRADRELEGFSLEAIRRAPITFAANSARQWAIQLGGSLGGARTCVSVTNGPYLCSRRMTDLSRPAFPNAPTASHRTLREWLVRYVKFGYIRMPIVLAFALLGVVAYFADARSRNPAGLLFALSIGYLTIVPAMLEWPQDRYRLPVDPLIFMFAAWGIVALGRLVTERWAEEPCR